MSASDAGSADSAEPAGSAEPADSVGGVGQVEPGPVGPVGPLGAAEPAEQGFREPEPRTLERIIALRVREHRLAKGLSIGEMAARVGISKAMLSKIENVQTSCSLSTLARLAAGLDVPVTALFRGVDTELEAVFTPAGAGAEIVRRGTEGGARYTLLGGLRGAHRRMEAHLVTLIDSHEVFPLFQHLGTELIFMIEGVMVYGHGESGYTLRPGDALQFDGEAPHGPAELVGLPIRFLSVIANPDPPRGLTHRVPNLSDSGLA